MRKVEVLPTQDCEAGYGLGSPLLKLACLCSISKLSTQRNASCSKLPKELKNGIGILVGQAVESVWIKTVKMLFGSITQELLSCLNCDDIFEFLGQFTAY